MRKNNHKKDGHCPICLYDNVGFIVKQKKQYFVRKCVNCGLEYVDPLPGAEELSNFYLDYLNPRAEEKTLKLNAIRNMAKLSKYGLTHDSCLLDFGCGKNVFVGQGGSKNWFGFDPYDKAPTRQIIKNFAVRKWDFITMWGVLEHLTNPSGQVKDLAGCLKIGGKLALTTVTIESEIPYQHKPPEHLFYWTNKAINNLFNQSGLKLLESSYYKMMQNSNIYFNCVLRTVPQKYKSKIFHKLPKQILVPTNEIFVIAEKAK